MKTCRKCGKEKKQSEFRLNRRMREGLSSCCAACHREATWRWRADHRNEINEARRVVPRFVRPAQCFPRGEWGVLPGSLMAVPSHAQEVKNQPLERRSRASIQSG